VEGSSWTQRLVSVAQTLVIQWVRILLEFAEPGGARPDASDNTLKTLLQHVPTPAVKNTFPLWHIESYTLVEWQEFFQEDRRPLVTETGIVLGRFKRDMEDLRHSSNSLPPHGIKEIIDNDLRASTAGAEKLNEVFSLLQRTIVEDQSGTAVHNHPDPFTLPPAALQGLPITPTDYAFITGSTAMKADIAIELAHQEVTGWGLLAIHCDNQMNTWKERLAELKVQQDILEQSHTAGGRMFSKLSKQARKVDALQAEIDAARANPAVARLLDSQAKACQMLEPETEIRQKK
jgi:hypothetical protein